MSPNFLLLSVRKMKESHCLTYHCVLSLFTSAVIANQSPEELAHASVILQTDVEFLDVLIWFL